MKVTKMNFCSLEEVLAACDTPRWSADNGTVELGVIRGTIPFSILRDLQAFDIFTSKLVHPSEGTLQALYDGGSEGALPTGSVFTLQLPRVIRRYVVAKNLADLLSLP